MKVTSTFPQLSPQPLVVRSWLIRACTILPPRSMALVRAALAWLVHTWMTLPLDPMGPAALTASKQTAGDQLMYESMKKEGAIPLDLQHMLWVCSVVGRVVNQRFGQKKKVCKVKVIFVLLWWWDMWTLKERPLLANYLEDCEFSNCLCNATARVHCCCSSTVGVLSFIVAMKHSILTHCGSLRTSLSTFSLIPASRKNPQRWV